MERKAMKINVQVWIGIFAIMFYFSSCKDGKYVDYYHNDPGEKIRTVRYYSNNKIIRYEHYNLDGFLCYRYDYNEPYTESNPQGKPLIQTVFNAGNYEFGDSLKLEMEIIEPPLFEIGCDIMIGGDTVKCERDSYKYYHFGCVYTQDLDSLVISIPVSKNGEPWFTYEKKYRLYFLNQ